MTNQFSEANKANTKDKLLEAALELFALYGYEGVSTREIVNKAGVNISAITYYFGGKEGLYNAVIESKVALFEDKILSDLENASSLKLTDKEQQKAFFLQLLEQYMNFLFSEGISSYLMMLFVREINHPSETFQVVYSRIISKISKAFTCLLAAIFDRPEDDEEIGIILTTIIGQILIFRISKNLILKRLNREGYDQEFVEKVKMTVLRQVELTLSNGRPL